MVHHVRTGLSFWQKTIVSFCLFVFVLSNVFARPATVAAQSYAQRIHNGETVQLAQGVGALIGLGASKLFGAIGDKAIELGGQLLMIWVFYYIADAVVQAFSKLVNNLLIWSFRTFILLTGYNDFLNNEFVNQGWTILRDIANLFFVIILLIIAFATVFRISSYQYQQLLPKFILAIFLVNFSRTIAGLIIDAAQVVMVTFASAFYESAAGNFIYLLRIDKWLKVHTIAENALDSAGQALSGAAEGVTGGVLAAAANAAMSLLPIENLIGMFFTLMVSVFALSIGLTLVFVIAYRIVALWMLIIVSPLAFLASVLPNTRSYFSQWFSMFTKQVVVGPVLAFFIWLALLTVQQNKESFNLIESSESITSMLGNLSGNPYGNELGAGAAATAPGAAPAVGDQQISLTEISTWNNLTGFLFSMLVLIGGIKFAGNMSGGAAQWAGKITSLANTGVRKGITYADKMLGRGGLGGAGVNWVQKKAKERLQFATQDRAGMLALKEKAFGAKIGGWNVGRMALEPYADEQKRAKEKFVLNKATADLTNLTDEQRDLQEPKRRAARAELRGMQSEADKGKIFTAAERSREAHALLNQANAAHSVVVNPSTGAVQWPEGPQTDTTRTKGRNTARFEYLKEQFKREVAKKFPGNQDREMREWLEGQFGQDSVNTDDADALRAAYVAANPPPPPAPDPAALPSRRPNLPGEPPDDDNPPAGGGGRRRRGGVQPPGGRPARPGDLPVRRPGLPGSSGSSDPSASAANQATDQEQPAISGAMPATVVASVDGASATLNVDQRTSVDQSSQTQNQTQVDIAAQAPVAPRITAAAPAPQPAQTPKPTKDADVIDLQQKRQERAAAARARSASSTGTDAAPSVAAGAADAATRQPIIDDRNIADRVKQQQTQRAVADGAKKKAANSDMEKEFNIPPAQIQEISGQLDSAMDAIRAFSEELQKTGRAPMAAPEKLVQVVQADPRAFVAALSQNKPLLAMLSKFLSVPLAGHLNKAIKAGVQQQLAKQKPGATAADIAAESQKVTKSMLRQVKTTQEGTKLLEDLKGDMLSRDLRSAAHDVGNEPGPTISGTSGSEPPASLPKAA